MKKQKITVLAAAMVLLTLPALAAERPSDSTIEYYVRAALQQDHRVETPLAVTAIDGIVTLEGDVDNLAARRFALMEAKKITGVRGVIDKVAITPEIRFDADVTADIEARLNDSPFPAVRNLTTTVLGGTATLRGAVPSFAERNQANLLASEVKGVREVVNDVVIEYPMVRPDREIERDIRANFDRDVYLVGLPLTIQVDHGKVRLTGETGSLFARERAADEAWVNGVYEVKNDVQLTWWDNNGARAEAPMPTDAELQAAVRDELYQDLRISDPYEIHVTAKNGQVRLDGTVPSYFQKTLASRNAADVVGVGWVSNLLQVQADRRSDKALRRTAMDRLDSDALTAGQAVAVEILNGNATLTGHTSTGVERAQAADVVAAIPGVRGVTNDLEVDRTALLKDASLRRNIEERLAAHDQTRLAAKDLKVAVEKGVVTLTGTVETWSARNAAGDLVFLTDGVMGVRNRIQVKGFSYPWDEFIETWSLLP